MIALGIGDRCTHAAFAMVKFRISACKGGHMAHEDELKPGIDKPRRGQYVIGVLVILVLTLVAYWWRWRA